MNNKYNNVVILGGGSAGWMTASYLAKNNPGINIKLIESLKIGSVGVGESTIPYIINFLKALGIQSDKEWLPHVDGAYKLGVLYENWLRGNERYWHSFEVDSWKFDYWFLEQGCNPLGDAGRNSYSQSCLFTGQMHLDDIGKVTFDAQGRQRVPHYDQHKMANGFPQPHAYHIDAALFGNYLRENHALKNGVQWIRGEAQDITRDSFTGDVKAIKLEDGRMIEGDLFIDCSGFKKFLIGKVAETPFRSFYPYLTHDRAIAARVPYTDYNTQCRPRTCGYAKSAGWIWDIPLATRSGMGHVYSSDYITEQAAMDEFVQHVGEDRMKDATVWQIKIDAGYWPEIFSKNVCAIGLSAGFIEPLESTALLAAHLSIEAVSSAIKGIIPTSMVSQQNVALMEEFKDFLSTRYYMSQRKDTPFWRDRGLNTKISDRADYWLNTLARQKFQVMPEARLFPIQSWVEGLIGFEWYPHVSSPEEYKKRFNYDPKQHDLAVQIMRMIKQFDTTPLLQQKEYLENFVWGTLDIPTLNHTFTEIEPMLGAG